MLFVGEDGVALLCCGEALVVSYIRWRFIRVYYGLLQFFICSGGVSIALISEFDGKWETPLVYNIVTLAFQ